MENVLLFSKMDVHFTFQLSICKVSPFCTLLSMINIHIIDEGNSDIIRWYFILIYFPTD